jgi:hypothetical protein
MSNPVSAVSHRAHQVNFAPMDWLPWGTRSLTQLRTLQRSPVFSHSSLLLSVARALVHAPQAALASSTRATLLDLVDHLVIAMGAMQKEGEVVRAVAEAAGAQFVGECAVAPLAVMTRRNQNTLLVKYECGSGKSERVRMSGASGQSVLAGHQCACCHQYCSVFALRCRRCGPAAGASPAQRPSVFRRAHKHRQVSPVAWNT